jgi:N-acetylated-alpha-linked acidic dipeptidase
MVLPFLLLAAQSNVAPIFGFSPESSVRQRILETKFDAALDAKDQVTWLKRLSARPHHVGSAYGLSNAEYMRDLYTSFGFQARIETFHVLFPTPKTRVLELGRFRAKLREPEVKGDETSRPTREALPPYNAFSSDGDVRGKLVYVNYGMPSDYETLAKRGIDVKGCIAIARYGGAWRGLKPKLATEHGAVGCIIYSDPRDDGYYQGDTYPNGAWRNPDSAQRGSVLDMPIAPGDPLTPGIGATADAPRIARKDAVGITKIPVLPIGYGDALPLLKDLTGPVAPDGWRGALPITYHLGPSRTEAHLKLEFHWDQVEARNVIAVLTGTEYPDQWVLRGNHHDAWVHGANDPLSGQVALLDEAKAIGTLAKTGWRPKRTIVYCSWDGEEQGLLGSTEWVETHAAELTAKAVAYINTDSTGRGFFGASGSHSLEHFVNQAAADVTDPETKLSVLERLRARDSIGDEATPKTGDLKIDALGSGSDFSGFLQHLGIAAVDCGFGGEDEGTQYHSAYDSFDWQSRFVDPGLTYGVVLAKTTGRMALRLANADGLPFEFTALAETVAGYDKELTDLVSKLAKDTERHNRQLVDGTLAATFDPTKVNVLPKPLAAVPVKLNLEPLHQAVARLKRVAAAFEANRVPGPSRNLTAIQSERALLGPGLPNRPWYRHLLYAPGLFTGYGVKTLPGVREAIEARDWPLAEAQAVLAAQALDRLSNLLESSVR